MYQTRLKSKLNVNKTVTPEHLDTTVVEKAKAALGTGSGRNKYVEKFGEDLEQLVLEKKHI